MSLVRRSIEGRKSKNEHTNTDIEHEKTESGVAEGVGGGATRAPREGEGEDATAPSDPRSRHRRCHGPLLIEKKYEFDGPKGKASLLDLFDGRRQLIVYRAFFEPGVEGWPEHACIGCSMVADQVAHPAHLNARDTTLVFVFASTGGECRASDKRR